MYMCISRGVWSPDEGKSYFEVIRKPLPLLTVFVQSYHFTHSVFIFIGKVHKIQEIRYLFLSYNDLEGKVDLNL